MMTKKITFLIVLIALFFVLPAKAQMTQVIRGTVTDKDSKYPLIGVNVVVEGSTPTIGVATNTNGEFELPPLKIGKYTLLFTYLGYKPAKARDITIVTGKQTVLQIEMEEQAITTDEVIVKGFRKGETLNKMVSVSARSFSKAETERYAGGLGDPGRMASNFAGVEQAGDGRNDIVIRGNSPMGLQWRIEGMDIPSPNHWSATGTTGGPVTMLNNNFLANSDFLTGAFPAQYGNALSGVFDLKMRSGNSHETEFTGQIGYNGFEFMAEGPFSKNYNGSYMVSYRYSVPALISLLGSTDDGLAPNYQDFTLKVDLPTKTAGKFSLFAITGKSSINVQASEVENSEQYSTLSSTNTFNESKLGILGTNHQYFFNEKSYLYTTFAISGSLVRTNVDSIRTNWVYNSPTDSVKNETWLPFYVENNYEVITSAATRYVNKINSKNTITAGFGYKNYAMAVRDSFRILTDTTDYYIKDTDTEKKGVNLINSYFEWQHKFNNKLTFNSGLHFTGLLMNQTYALEPRAGLSYELSPSVKIGAGYGMHSKMQTLLCYFVNSRNEQTGEYFQTNNNLDFSRAHHYVISYDQMFTTNLHLKVEAYYQNLYNIPVTSYPSYYSIINEGATFHLNRVDSLVNKGTGKNYGIELTLERYLANNFYYMLTGSVFDSKYTPSDGIERNTTFATNYATNLLTGYEYRITEKYSLDCNVRFVYSGGKRNQFIDFEASQKAGETVYNDEKHFSERESDYMRLDLRLGLKNYYRRFSQEWAIDISNITNHKNVYMRTYNVETNEIDYVYQAGLSFMFLYRINF